MDKVWASEVLPYVLPPVLGALIGYVTNALAIKMLFRPLRAVRIFGIRLPFTPGIIPRRREKLAESIGSMVSRELLTESAFRKKLSSPGFLQGLARQVGRFTDHALALRLHSRHAEGFSDLISLLEEAVRGRFREFLASGEFEDLVGRAAARLAESLFSRPLAKVMEEMGLDEEGLGAMLSRGLSGPLPERLFDSLSEAFVRRVRRGATAESFFSALLPEDLEGRLDRLYPAIVGRLFALAGSPEVKREMAFRGRFLLRDILSELNFFQRLILTAGQYDRTLDDKMPKIVDDLLVSAEGALWSEAVRERVVSAAGAELRRIAALPLADLFAAAGTDAASAAASAKDRLLKMFSRIDPAGFLSSRGSRTIFEVLETDLGISGPDILARVTAASAAIVRKSVSGGVPGLKDSLAESFLRLFEGKTLGEIIRLSPDRKERLDLLLSEGIFSIMTKRLPEVLRSFEVAALVTDRVNDLDVESVERLLLEVMARHLTWINVFGGILGALIGGTQVLISHFY